MRRKQAFEILRAIGARGVNENLTDKEAIELVEQKARPIRVHLDGYPCEGNFVAWVPKGKKFNYGCKARTYFLHKFLRANKNLWLGVPHNLRDFVVEVILSKTKKSETWGVGS